MGFLWTGAIIAFFVIEIATYQLVSTWFGVGAIAGLISYLCGAGIFVQCISFILVSAFTLILTRPLAKKLSKNKGEKTNTDRLIGKKIVITKSVNSFGENGETVIGGVAWTVNSVDGQSVEEGETATIEAIEGVRLIVRK